MIYKGKVYYYYLHYLHYYLHSGCYKHIRLYQLKVNVGMLNTVKNDFADVLSVGPLSERRANARSHSDEGPMLETSAKSFFYSVQHTHINLHLIQSIVFPVTPTQTHTSSYRAQFQFNVTDRD